VIETNVMPTEDSCFAPSELAELLFNAYNEGQEIGLPWSKMGEQVKTKWRAVADAAADYFLEGSKDEGGSPI